MGLKPVRKKGFHHQFSAWLDKNPWLDWGPRGLVLDNPDPNMSWLQLSCWDGNPLLNLISCFLQFLFWFDAPSEDPVGLRLLHLPQCSWCPPLLHL